MKKNRSAKDYFSGIIRNDRVILAQAITLIESVQKKDREVADDLLRLCQKNKKSSSIRIGITGSPGAGKSTFIESFGQFLIDQKKQRVCVLAVDPSSASSKGSILGDKTRMPQLSTSLEAFVRPSPTSGNTEGVTFRTRETILLCEAAGYNIILIETVGIGQSQLAVHSMVDFLMLLVLAGGGDILQGIKRGIVEVTDLIVVTKADKNNLQAVKLTQLEYKMALALHQKKESGWKPVVLTCSGLENIGIEIIWETIQNYVQQTQENGYFSKNRDKQILAWIKEKMQEKASLLIEDALEYYEMSPEGLELNQDLLAGRIAPNELAQRLLKKSTY